MSLKTLADLAGLSQSFLSMVENGHRELDRRSHIGALADALQVSVADLTGQPYSPVDQEHSDARACLPAVRLALMANTLGHSQGVSARPLPALSEQVRAVSLLCQASDYAGFGPLLPALLVELHAASAENQPSRREALRLLIEVCHSTFFFLKDLGFLDLAWVAVNKAADAAEQLGDPEWTAATEFFRAHALMAAGAYPSALATAGAAADAVQSVPRASALEVYGMLHLTSALASTAARRSAEAEDHLGEAMHVARRTGEGNAHNLHFGPTNATLWRIAVEVERGEGGRVGELAEDVDPTLLDSRGRQAAFYSDLGRGAAQVRGRDAEAIDLLRRAENLAPQQVRTNPLIRETVTGLLRRARREAGGRELRGLAYRMGVEH